MDIEEYLFGCSNKTRVLLILLSTGLFTFSQLRVFTTDDLLTFLHDNNHHIEASGFKMFCDDIVFQKKGDDFIFINHSGRKLSERDMQNTLIKACIRTGKPYIGYQEFVERFSQ